MQKRKHLSKNCLILFAVLAIAAATNQLKRPWIIVDLATTFLALLLFSRQKRFWILVATVAFWTTWNFGSAVMEDVAMSRSVVEAQADTDTLIQYATDHDDGFFRINDKTGDLHVANRVINPEHRVSSVYSSLSNLEYQQFYYDHIGNDIRNPCRGQLTNPHNFLFDLYIGNKYVIGRDMQPMGSQVVATDGDLVLYRLADALPVGYMSDRLMSRSYFDTLRYPYDAEALLNYVIVDSDVSCDYETAIEPITLGYTIVEQEGLEIKAADGGYRIIAENGGNLKVQLDSALQDQVLFLEFALDGTHTEGDGLVITMNGMSNIMPAKDSRYYNGNDRFQYSFNDSLIDSFCLTFSPGTYSITDIRAYTADYDAFVSRMGDVSPMEFDTSEPIGDVIRGTVTSETDGYLNLTIPYDEAFTLYIDGKETAFEKTDTAFIGLFLQAGKHEIKLVYNAPAAGISRIISLCAWVGFAAMLLVQHVSSRRKKSSRKELVSVG